MILEGIITTENADGSTNVAPMGPRVDAGMRQIVLRPFQTSRTFENLRRTRAGVFHVVDDVELLTKAAIDQWDELPDLLDCPAGHGKYLPAACRWYALQVVEYDDSAERAEFVADVVAQQTLKEFFGLNRAKFAVVEAAILATRLGLLEQQFVEAELERLAPLVDKTAGPAEHRAWHLIRQFVSQHAPQASL